MAKDRLPEAVRESSSTAAMGPTEHRAMRPKLFSPAFRPPTVRAMPTPRAIRKGTVIGPVVTPPESKESGRKEPFPLSIRTAARQNSTI